MVEFGVNEGRTARAILQNVKSMKHYVGIDVPPTCKPTLPFQRREIPQQPGNLAKHDPRFELIVKPRGSFDVSLKELPICDAVFIDGDHSQAGVLQDYGLAKKVIRPGGVIIFHDYHGEGVVEVREVLHDLMSSGVKLQHVSDTWLAFQQC